MQAELELRDKVLTLVIKGDLDQLTLTKDYWVSIDANAKKQLQGAARLMVCLNDVDRADSAGLAWLINLKRDLKHNNVDVSIHDSPTKLIALAKLSNADSFLV
ncbi:MAG: phospholipid transport system transporter-binding protein [Bermanella sp.]|jgi:phospholipid transport system transporter-binding protein|uniref:STAS domain-containing protein n=1 Tax=Glaciecola sp. 33A TaxID=2057807 RepID=UPI000C34147D|nr:STAS domain-containing protein [Glaciecola sp. 33A]PKI01409.1 sulfate transporter [Glaciecola sp. 33A]